MASKIEWTEQTWNPLAGCSIVSPGCHHCYAERMAKRLQAMGQEKYRGTTDIAQRLHERFNDPKGGRMIEWPTDISVREFPREERLVTA